MENVGIHLLRVGIVDDTSAGSDTFFSLFIIGGIFWAHLTEPSSKVEVRSHRWAHDTVDAIEVWGFRWTVLHIGV